MAKPTTPGERFLDFIELRRHSIITPQEVRSLQIRWNRALRLNLGIIHAEHELFCTGSAYGVSKESTEIGIANFRKLCFQKNGEPRATTFTRQMSRAEIEAVRTFTRFELHRFEFSGHNIYPQYALNGSNGGRVHFLQRPWQAGGIQL